MTDRSTTRGGWRDSLGWFPALFASVLGAPALLALFQDVFVEHRLVALFAWIPEGYHLLMDTLGKAIEPPLHQVFAWLHEMTGATFALTAHWRSIFVLLLMFGLAAPRGSSLTASQTAVEMRSGWATFFLLKAAALSFVAGLLCGLRPENITWIDAMLTGFIAGAFLPVPTETGFRGLPIRFFYGAVVGTFAAIAGLFPALLSYAVEVALAAGLGLMGTALFVSGSANQRKRQSADAVDEGAVLIANTGLVMLGGMLTAAAILVASAIMQLLGA